MARKLFTLEAFVSIFKFPLRRSRNMSPYGTATLQGRFLKRTTGTGASLIHITETIPDEAVLAFHLEGALLKSCSLFPYFMLVAFEAGGLLRALILLLLYPLVLLLGREQKLKILVFVSFVGVKEKNLRVGSAVLPKFLLEDVGCEGFDAVMSCKRRVAVSDLPRVMVEGFLKDYLGVEAVVGRELKAAHGYFLGLMEEKKQVGAVLNEMKRTDFNCIGLGCLEQCHDQKIFANCKDVYLVTEVEKRNWKILPRKKYPKPLIFHDGRLAFRPTPAATLYMFMWIPFGVLLYVFRTIIFASLPYKLSSPIMSFSGMIITTSKLPPKSPIFSSNSEDKKPAVVGRLFVCNHRTLLDPIYISIALMKPVSAVTYSVSRYSEVISPIKTVRLTRDREKDRETMEKQLSQGDLVVCPEGTTCREPYLLRFSPLFAELSDEIVPVAIDQKVSMFYGSTANGFKGLDSAFQLMNPNPTYSVNFLNKLSSSDSHNSVGKSRFEVANHVQDVIAKALRFESTNLTRKDKYMILAGTQGII